MQARATTIRNRTVGAVLILGAIAVGVTLALWIPLLLGAYVVALGVNIFLLVLDGLHARLPQRIPVALLGAPVVAAYDFLKVAAFALLVHAIRSVL